MSLKSKLLVMLKNKRGNALLLATAGAIAATFAIYFFVALTALTQENKERVTHLYNAYQMGLAVKMKIIGNEVGDGEGNLDKGLLPADLTAAVNDNFAPGYISLKTMVSEGIIVIGDDVSAAKGVPYNKTLSGVNIKYLESGGGEAGTNDPVTDLQLLVNLAGTTDATGNSDAKMGPGGAFFYVISHKIDGMSDEVKTAFDNATINIIDAANDFPTGILDETAGGPQGPTHTNHPNQFKP